MTVAICVKCGEAKWGALTPCEKCGARPAATRDIALSLLLSDHYYDNAQLAQIGAAIKRGEHIALPDEAIATIERSLRDENTTAVSASKEGMRPRPSFTYLWSLLTHRGRNKRAAQTIHALRSGRRPAFCLYLRGFSDDHSSFNRRCERLLSQSLGEEIPLLGLTGLGSALGMARIRSTDQEWYEDFLLLATNAIVIFVQAPSLSSGKGDFERHKGLIKEIRTLYERRLLGRTAFVQRGDLYPHRSPAQVLASNGTSRALAPSAIQELIAYYSQFVGLDPPQPSDGMILAWQIMFDPDVRAQYSL